MEAFQKPKFKKKQQIENNIYIRSLITRNISLPIVNIGKNVQQTIERFIIDNYEGKCVVEGFIKNGSSKIITFSSGLIKGTNISFEVVFECKVCSPVEGMLIQCVAKNITKAGIRAESSDETLRLLLYLYQETIIICNRIFQQFKKVHNSQQKLLVNALN